MRSYTSFQIILIDFLLFQFLFCGSVIAQDRNPENEVRAVILKFKDGVEKGDKNTGQKLATKEISSTFVPLYNLLADTYSKARMDFPVEIGYLKILNDGRAKVETYLNAEKDLFVFTLKKENSEWKISHLKNIRFPLYSIPSMPYENIYNAEGKRGWMKAEEDLAFKTKVYYKIKDELGEKAATDILLDGPGFRVAMDAWLPFIEGAAQFALFYVILEKNYYSANYIVIDADLEKAEIHCNPLIELDILKRAVSSPKFTMEEYKAIYTSIMKQRAKACGLDIEISFDEINCVIKLKRVSKSSK